MLRRFSISIAAIFFLGCGAHQQPSLTPKLPEYRLPLARKYEASREKTARAVERSIKARGWEIDPANSQPPYMLQVLIPSDTLEPQRANISIGEPLQNTTGVMLSFITTGWDEDAQREKDKQFHTEIKYTLSNGLVDTPQEKAQREAALAASLTQYNRQEIIVTAGPLSQQYRALGEVQANTLGFINVGSILHDSLFRSRLSVAAAGATPQASQEKMNELLRNEARRKYGNRVDAVINVTYQTRPDGEVFANGLAVQFIEEPQATPAPPPAPTLESRLEELKTLREKNLVTPEEYYEKRSKLLEGL